MIRTSVIVSPRQEVDDRLYFHANGLQIDVSTASQSIVRTSHRPVQIYSATRSGFRQQASNLTAQTGSQGQRWQRLMDILDRQGSDALPGLFSAGEMTGEWITALDERRLNALLNDRFSFYLFRDGDLRELRPVSQLKPPDSGAVMNHYRITIAQDDQVLIMPKEMITAALMPEAEQILLGMQQLPVRLSELGSRLRERGVTTPFNGWMALQVLRAEAEYTIPEHGLGAWIAGRRKTEEDGKGPGFSDSISAIAAASAIDSDSGDDGETDSGRNVFSKFSNVSKMALMGVAFVIGAALLTLLFRFVILKPTETSQTTRVSATTVQSTTATTSRPTTTAATVAPLPEWFVIARQLNLRAEPKLASTLIRTLTTGQSVFIIEQTNVEWTKVRTKEGEIGYVYAAYISKDKPAG